jgi:aminoglycoside/choline kinase family phosphotransferase/NDP-sugar pyrophosphorylase family protein
MADSIRLFLPSAGLGERLRPITDHIPKPLLPVLGKPLIESILEKAALACPGRIGINLHYKPEMIRRWAANSPFSGRITFFSEDRLLGTGGALKNAEAFLSDGHFIVHNSDIVMDIDFPRLIEAHISSGNVATLVTHRHPGLSNVVIDEKGHVIGVEMPGRAGPGAPGERKVAFTGVAVYSPEIFRFLPGGFSHVTVAWLNASAAGRAVGIVDVTGSSWIDIGSPPAYASAVLEALVTEGETLYRSASAVCGAVEIDGYVVMESGSEVADGSCLGNCVVMPGARVSGRHANRIIGPDYAIDLACSEMQPPTHAAGQKRVCLSDPLFADYFQGKGSRSGPAQVEPVPAFLIGFGGSDRRYFRVRSGPKSAILMQCRPDDRDFERHVQYTRFLSSHGIPVPRLLSVDKAQKSALFEDLGDTSLYTYLKLPHSGGHVEDLYRRVLDILAALHLSATAHIDECRLLGQTVFDYDHFRWETGYFLEWFVSGLRGIAAEDPAALDEEFHRLAAAVEAFPKTAVHRDFQSQNIMITTGPAPRLIDYQGARMGPPAYDLASILWDPYCRLDDGLRERLLAYYITLRKEEEKTFSEDDFRKTVLPCRLQRHMQALGAYAFLSRAKGKSYFLKHVPEGLRLLREDCATAKDRFPALRALVGRL